jgi:transcriptional regulator
MYVPPAFDVKDPKDSWDAIRAHPLGLLISQGDDGIVANPVPFEVSHSGATTTLRTHLARANGQWRRLEGQSVLIVFQGADAYVSPQWYETKKEHGRVVPTWNYSVIQVRGRARVIDDKDWLLALVSRLTDHHEHGVGQGKAWSVTDAPDDYIQSQLRAIVGVEIEVTQIHGKLKASQNRTQPDRTGVVEGLKSLGGDNNEVMAALVNKPSDELTK